MVSQDCPWQSESVAHPRTRKQCRFPEAAVTLAASLSRDWVGISKGGTCWKETIRELFSFFSLEYLTFEYE